MTTYAELRASQQKELNAAFPIKAAFNEQQLQEGMAELGITNERDVHVIAHGCFIRRTDKTDFYEMMARHCASMQKALLNDEFAIDALAYELGNHEFCITHDPSEAMEILGFSCEDERHRNLLRKALTLVRHYEESY